MSDGMYLGDKVTDTLGIPSASAANTAPLSNG